MGRFKKGDKVTINPDYNYRYELDNGKRMRFLKSALFRVILYEGLFNRFYKLDGFDEGSFQEDRMILYKPIIGISKLL